MPFLASSTSSLKRSSGSQKESSYSSTLMNAPQHKKGSHHPTTTAVLAAAAAAPFRRPSTSSAVAEHRDTSPANDNRDENELVAAPPLHRNHISSVDDIRSKSNSNKKNQYGAQGSTTKYHIKHDGPNAAADVTPDAGEEEATARISVAAKTSLDKKTMGDVRTSPLPEQEAPNASHSLVNKETERSQSSPSYCNDHELPQSSLAEGAQGHNGYKSSSQTLQRSRGNRYTYSSKGAFRHPHHHPRNNNAYHQHQHRPSNVSDQQDDNGLHVAAQEPERFVSSGKYPKSTRGSKDLPCVSSTSTNLGTHFVRQHTKKSYYTAAKRGKFARAAAAASGSGGRHHASKFRNVNGPREMDQTPVVEHVQDEQPQTNRKSTSPGPLLSKEQSDTSKFVMESSTQTEQVDNEQQETRKQREEEESQKVVTSNAAGLALLHRLSQGMAPKEEENTNAQDEEVVSAHHTETHVEAEIDSVEVKASLTTDKSSLKEEPAALDIIAGTTSENATYDKNVWNNLEQSRLEPSMQDKPYISSHEATKEDCETCVIPEEEEREITAAGTGDQYIDEENLPSYEQNEFYPPPYTQPCMIYSMMIPSNGYPPAPQQEIFYPRFLQQYPIQQPIACVTAPAPYNEYTMAPYVTYGYPPVDYGGYPNSESAPYEEYMRPPMDGSAATVDGNINTMENGSVEAPLKYEQTVIGGTVYFNPVYVEDYQNVEITEEVHQEESHRDQEEQDEIYNARRAEGDSGSKNANKSVLSKKTKGKKNKHRKYRTNTKANA